MLKKVLFGIAAAILAFGSLVAANGYRSKATPPQEGPRVICRGECQPGDDCLKKCEVLGDVPKDLKLACCGHCQKGDTCWTQKASCCEAK